MKYIKVKIFIYLLIVSLNGFAYSDADVYSYVAQHKETALKFEKEYGIPAAITLAQAILESGSGTSSLTRASNNHFGIKAGNSWGGNVYYAWDDEPQKSRFRSYSSAEDSFRDYANLITGSSYYRPLFSINIYDYRGWAHGLKKAGYASAPHYAQALIGIIEHYKLYNLNGGVKLKPGKTVVITKYIDAEKPVFEAEDIASEDEEGEEENIINAAMVKYAVEINGVSCTVVQPGETLASISRRFDISPDDLLKFNELASSRQVKEGDIIFLDSKRKKYEGSQDFYVTKAGETLHDVSQKFGIKSHNLAKMNKLDDYILLDAGTKLYLK
ncbi:MAG: glucosaminidase domain-containing protein [Muribaculaceae bacterium]|nr:glucosaminidase domain-containing protein [Muribaculaceae bacterium]